MEFVEVDKYEGPGSGPGYSLNCCKKLLQKPFYFVSCDTLFEVNLDQTPAANWVGVSQVTIDKQASYCNILGIDGVVTDIFDKKM